jgi:hypothetical protein
MDLRVLMLPSLVDDPIARQGSSSDWAAQDKRRQRGYVAG